jgi:hypothetical protein
MVEIAQEISCPDCGAPLKVRAGEAIVTCEYCGSDVNLAVGTKYFLKHSIIQPKLDNEAVAKLVHSWMSKGFLKPGDLARKYKVVGMELQILPMFIVHVVARTDYEGALTRTGENLKRKDVLEKEYYWKVLGRRASRFPTREYDIPLSAKTDFDISKLMEGCKFLNSELDEAESENLARQEIEAHHRFLLSQELDEIHSISTVVEVRDTEFLHVPAWFVSYQYKGRVYELILDGATGEDVKAEIPPIESKGFLGKMFGG